MEKYNGEEPFIEGNADSILELTTFMIQTLLFIPKPDKPVDLFGQTIIDQYIVKANDLIKFLQPPGPEASDEEPKSQPDVQDKSSKIDE